MKRNFDEWLSTFEDSIATWKYYTDFDKVYKNVDKIKKELNLLNSLIGSKNIEQEFRELIEEYPKVISVIPILIAKRDDVIIIKDAEQDYYYNFKEMNYSIEDYIKFMRNSGVFDLLENHLISNLYDYVTGVEVGMDTNARKSRTGDCMEDLVESYIVKSGFVKGHNYFKEMTTKQIKDRWSIDLTSVEKNKKAEKRFDFVVKTGNMLYVVETNFYNTNGSKLNETARSYKNLQQEISKVDKVTFVWFTDGKGWNSAKKNLKETFDIMEHLYSINDMKQGIVKEIVK